RMWDSDKRVWVQFEGKASGDPFSYPIKNPLYRRDVRAINSHNVIIVANDQEQVVCASPAGFPQFIQEADFSLPPGANIGDAKHDNGLRFFDLDGDGKLDLIFSNEKEFGIYLFADMKTGWS